MYNAKYIRLKDTNLNFEIVHNSIVSQLINYIDKARLKSLVLGISGGIDSSVCAVICREVADKCGIPFIGRSLTISNSKNEYTTSNKIGKAFCSDFCEVHLGNMYSHVLNELVTAEGNHSDKRVTDLTSPISLGNIQARLRMMYLYHLAGMNKGIVIDTDNLTESCTGFFTVHGDQGDFKPIGNLWKTEVYAYAKWLLDNKCTTDKEKQALQASIDILPTDGLGISNTDTDQLDAKDYYEVDTVFNEFFKYVRSTDKQTMKQYVDDFIKEHNTKCTKNILNRYLNTNYKRNSVPVCQIG